AVPGPVTSPSSAGTNALLAEGCGVVRDASDVLVSLGLATAAAPTPVDEPPLPATERVVVDAFEWRPATFDELLARTGLAVDELAPVLHRLAEAGWVDQR